MRLLVQRGADRDAPGVDGMTPKALAVASGNESILAALGVGDEEREDLWDEEAVGAVGGLLGGIGYGGGGSGMGGSGLGGAGIGRLSPGRAGGLDFGMVTPYRERLLRYDVFEVAERADVGRTERDASLIEKLVRLGRYRAAERVTRDLLAAYEKPLDPDPVALAQLGHNLGRILTFGARYEVAAGGRWAAAVAVAAGRAAAPPAGGSSTHEAASLARENLALLHAVRGCYDEALTGLEAVHEERRDWGGGAVHLQARVELNRADLLTELGRYANAEAGYEVALVLRTVLYGADDAAVAAVQHNRAVLLELIGDHAAAAAIHEALLEGLEATGAQEAAQLAMARAKVAGIRLSRNEADAALALAQAALAGLESRYGESHEARPSLLAMLASANEVAGHEEEARRLAADALAAAESLLGEEHPVTIGLLARRGLARLAENDVDGGQADLVEALALADEADVARARWVVRTAYARLLLARKQPGAAIYMLKQAVNVLQGVRQGLRRMDGRLRKAFVADKEVVYRQLADLLIAAGRLPEARETLAMLKGEEYFDFVRRDRTRVPEAISAAFTGPEAGLVKRYEALSSQLASLGSERAKLRSKRREGALSDEDRTRLKAIRKDLRVARQAFGAYVAALETELGGREKRDRRDVRGVEALQDTLRELGHGAVALHAFVGADRLHLLLTAEEIQIARESPVGEAELNQRIHAFREVLAAPGKDPLPAAKALWDVVIGPVERDLEQLGAETLMVSLDGALRYIPLAALHDGERWLGQRWAVALLTEAARDKLRQRPRRDARIAGLGTSVAHEGFQALPAVPGELDGIVRREAEDADGVVPGVIHLDAAFTADTLLDVLDEGFSIVHVASHFELKPGTGRDSFLLLGDGAHLTLHDLEVDDYGFRGVDLLTLSACNTGVGGGDASGREVEGFGALAQRRGARAVIATLWPVSDRSTGLFMQRLYAMATQQPELSRAEVVRRVQRSFIEGTVGEAEGAAGAADRGAAAPGASSAWT